jgi:excisionase family DNA binding protein
MTRKASGEKPKRMKLSDAAAYLGVSPAKVSRLIRSGELPFTVDGLDKRRRIVSREHLDRIKEQSLNSEEDD